MLLKLTIDPRDYSSCALSYNEAEQWLQADWRGYVDPSEAQRGAEAYLRYAGQRPSPFLLNNNSQMQGPWFTGLNWLGEVWVPQAVQLGLRYVAHVTQAGQYHDVLSLQPLSVKLPFELQVFEELADARHWLHECQAASLYQK